MNQDKTQNASDNDIAKHAYHLWEADGRPAGRDMEYWLKAKSQLAGAQSSQRPPQDLKTAQSQSGQSRPAQGQSSQGQGGQSASTTATQPAEVAQNGEKQPRKKKGDTRSSGKEPAFA